MISLWVHNMECQCTPGFSTLNSLNLTLLYIVTVHNCFILWLFEVVYGLTSGPKHIPMYAFLSLVTDNFLVIVSPALWVRILYRFLCTTLLWPELLYRRHWPFNYSTLMKEFDPRVKPPFIGVHTALN